MLPRAAAVVVRRRARHAPVVVLTGPRQSGKTTLARAVFARKPYATLEDLDTREFAERDPRAFLAQFRGGAILDEAQRAPALFSYLQSAVDSDRAPGRFVLTGSQQFGLLSGISQSLAGRSALVHLLPFALAELDAAHHPRSLEDLLWRGLYPSVVAQRAPPEVWYPDYAATYLERDVRQLVNVRDLAQFRRFVRMCAARTGQMLNLSSLAADCGVTHNTARAWISVLEASYLVHLLPPYHRNFGKRLVKAPKLYFIDTGLAASLIGIRNAKDLEIHPARGALFETWAVAEMLKRRFNAGLPADLYFWRDSAGLEADLVVERAGRLHALEIKSGTTIATDWIAMLGRIAQVTGASTTLLYGGMARQARTGAEVFGWREAAKAARHCIG